MSTLEKNPNKLKGLEDVVNKVREHEEGAHPGQHEAYPSGQDNLEESLRTKGEENDTYQEALAFIRRKSRSEGIDAAMKQGEVTLDGLLVPIQSEGGVACQVAAKAGYPMITIPFGVADDG